MADVEAKAALHEVEPSPVEETPSQTKDSYFTFDKPAASSESKGTTHLGLSHNALWYLSRIQRYSTYAFSVFGVFHITNTSLIPLITRSVPASEPYLLLTRPYYQGLPAEILLVVAPIWAHVLSGIAMRIYRRNLNAKRFGDSESNEGKSFFSSRFWPSVSGISKLGYQLWPLVFGHVFINRGIPNQFEGGSSNINLSYVSHAFAKHPAVSFVGFTALVTVGCWHITWGWSKWLGYTPDQTTEMGDERAWAKKWRWYIINGVAAAVTGIWMAGAFGVVARGGAATGWLGKLYDQMCSRVPVVGQWM